MRRSLKRVGVFSIAAGDYRAARICDGPAGRCGRSQKGAGGVSIAAGAYRAARIGDGAGEGVPDLAKKERRVMGSDDDVEDDLPRAVDELGNDDHVVAAGVAGIRYGQRLTDGRRGVREGVVDRGAVRFGAGDLEAVE